MPKRVSLPYGTGTVDLDCRSDADIYAVADPVKSVKKVDFARQVASMINRCGLDLSLPAVVVADKTRLCGYPDYLPVLLDTLVQQGANRDEMTLFIAYGTHLRQSDEDSLKAYGRTYETYRWVHHRCDGDPFKQVGETRRGIPVHIRQDLADASGIVTFGAISHHYFAGYGGGRKLLFPGLGKKEGIYANHALFLDRAARHLAEGCRPGQLDGNPLAEDLADVESFMPADMAIHGILNSRGEVCDLMVGQGEAHFRKACARHAESCEVAAKRRYGLVVASCGGFPKDINFIQSHKAIHHAAEFVRDGGRLIVLAECRDGIGSHTFLPWFELGGWDAAFDQLSSQYVGNGGTALAMMAKLRRIRISLVTRLDAEVAASIGIDPISASQVQACIEGHDGVVALIPNASLTVRKIQER